MSIYTFIIVAGITVLAVLKKENVLLRILCCPLLIIYGLYLAKSDATFTTLWTAGVIIAVYGTSLLLKEGLDAVRRRKRRDTK